MVKWSPLSWDVTEKPWWSIVTSPLVNVVNVVKPCKPTVTNHPQSRLGFLIGYTFVWDGKWSQMVTVFLGSWDGLAAWLYHTGLGPKNRSCWSKKSPFCSTNFESQIETITLKPSLPYNESQALFGSGGYTPSNGMVPDMTFRMGSIIVTWDDLAHDISEIFWLVVSNMFYDFPFSWEWNNHPNWRTPSFFRGVGIPPIRLIYSH